MDWVQPLLEVEQICHVILLDNAGSQLVQTQVNEVAINIDLMLFRQLQEFRQTLYNTLGNSRDALFDLMDAVLVSASIVSFVSLSQSPVFRRG
jgi:hypothetical protein